MIAEWAAPYNFTRDAIGRLAAERPTDRALLWVGPDGTAIDRSFAQLADAAARAATVMARAGVGRGDTVLLLKDHVKAITAPYKYPRQIAFVDGLPKTVSGKIQRKVLREQEWARGEH